MVSLIQIIGILIIAYIAMNRLFYYMDGDYKRTPNPRNRTRKNVMNNPD